MVAKKIDRLGETKIMNCGMEATIIRYKVLPFIELFSTMVII